MQRFYKRVPKKQRFVILSEHFNDGLSISELSRKYQIQPATIYKWREKMKKEEDKSSFDSRQLLEEIKSLKQENSLLKQTVAQQALCFGPRLTLHLLFLETICQTLRLNFNLLPSSYTLKS